MSAETKRIRAACLARADGACESCGRTLGESGHMDHFAGRARVKQSVASCWMLCLNCDYQKTNNQPTSAWWLESYAAHCRRHGYGAELERAAARLQFVLARGRRKRKSNNPSGRPSKGLNEGKVLVSGPLSLIHAAEEQAASEGVSVREWWRRAARRYLGMEEP